MTGNIVSIHRQPKKSLTPELKALALDKKESAVRLKAKEAQTRKQWPEKGDHWRDMIRRGRTFTRVQTIEPVTPEAETTYKLRDEAGWEWVCPNCKTYSIIRESDMPAVLEEWAKLAQDTQARGFKPPVKPTAATAGCPNCKYRPGAPE